MLIKAASGGSVSEAGTLMTAYSLGLGIPFLLTALALDQAQGLFRRLQRNMRAIEAFSGAFLILIGVLVFSGQLERLTRIGGSQGAFGDLSLNLENCAIAVVEGQVRLGNARDCLSDGVKEDFYIADPKGIELVSAEASAENSASFPDLAADSSGEGSTGLDVPSLDASAPTGSAPEPDAPAANAPVGLEIGQRPISGADARRGDSRPVGLPRADGAGQFLGDVVRACREEMPDFETIYNLHGPKFVVLAVNNQEEPDTVGRSPTTFLHLLVVLDGRGLSTASSTAAPSDADQPAARSGRDHRAALFRPGGRRDCSTRWTAARPTELACLQRTAFCDKHSNCEDLRRIIRNNQWVLGFRATGW